MRISEKGILSKCQCLCLDVCKVDSDAIEYEVCMHKIKHTMASQLCGLLLYVRKRMLSGIKNIVFLMIVFAMV
jgi:hypothetical protein